MKTMALINAGGMGERMRATHGPVPKPLVPVAGVPLLERNFRTLQYFGQNRVTIVIGQEADEIASFIEQRIEPLARQMGTELTVYTETEPRGNIGCVGDFRDQTDELLVVYADNLTALDLGAIQRHHRNQGATATIATHYETSRLDYGEVAEHDGWITGYTEKPERKVLICSAICVFDKRALAYVDDTERLGLSQLISRLLEANEKVSAFRHEAPWVDVNDGKSIERAEALVARHRRLFEQLLGMKT